MNLTCPSCGSANTTKLSLMISRGATTAEGVAKFGSLYVANFVVPLLGFFFTLLTGILFGLWSTFAGLVVFAGGLYLTMRIRRKIVHVMRPIAQQRLTKLDEQLKANGFQCQRCEHLFVPAEPAGIAP